MKESEESERHTDSCSGTLVAVDAMNSFLVLLHHLLRSLVVLIISVESKKKKKEDILAHMHRTQILSSPLLSLSGALLKKGILWLKDLDTNHLRNLQDRIAITTKSSAFISHLSIQLEYLFLIMTSS